MHGNSKAPIVLTSRDRLLLKELATAKVVDCETVKAIAGFRSTSRANSRLLKLYRAGFLKRFFVATEAGGRKSLYSLSKKGAEEIQAQVRLVQRGNDSLLIGDQFVGHQQDINTIWVQVKFRSIPLLDVQLARFLTFPSPLSKQTPLIPDGYFELNTPSGLSCLFCEVDRGTETLKVWAKKISHYLELAVSGEFQVLFKQSRFRVLVVAHSERRLNILRHTVLKHTNKIFWFSTLEQIKREGLFAPIWLRPEGGGRLPLF